jgi:ribosomal protein L12E/L44/L45/RPP1/RPP2
MVRLPLTADELERGQRLGSVLRRARGERSMLEVALEAGVSPETLRIAALAHVLSLSLDEVWAEINPPRAAVRPRSLQAL